MCNLTPLGPHECLDNLTIMVERFQELLRPTPSLLDSLMRLRNSLTSLHGQLEQRTSASTPESGHNLVSSLEESPQGP